ncbi:16S rRNA processing protein RimM [Leptospira broomii serovar Hurstbridge str. 5399]|uniref:Ribosome maturation factor RimM n=1 Tax=Leptospira broomii serovar Hurstbridge str. 5399 TaxID=1049789 RepID=T0EWE6_9LEPT|nr:ribosome maturation factor RimM [Leptospira broomii]EQA43175.1 16S rRNA processing protein RimM [Leptospira broomii serovar Hurstbridge str. 5399]
MTENQILAGKLGKPFGLKGFIRLVAQESSLPTLKHPLSVILRFPGKPDLSLVLLETKIHSGRIHLRFQDYSTPEDSTKLTGASVFVDRSVFPASEGDEYYLFELQGLRGIAESGEDLNWILEDIMENPAHPILLFREGEKEILVPFIDQFVGKILLTEGKIFLKNPEIWDEV